MAKSIITQDGDLVNYNNLVAISVEERAVGFDEEHSEDEYCIIGTDTSGNQIPMGNYKTPEAAEAALKDLYEWLNREAYAVYEIKSGGDE